MSPYSPHVLHAFVFAATVNLTQWIKVGKRRLPEVMTVRNAAEFKEQLAAGHLVSLRSANNEPIKSIINWRDAVEASQRKDGSILTLTSAAALYEDVDDLKRAVSNRATGLESQTTHAIAHDPELNDKYAPLNLVNGGRAVKFYHKDPRSLLMEVDGLVVNSTVVLANECKSALDPLHVLGDPDSKAPVKGMLERAAQLERILALPQLYESDPPEAFAQCAGKRVKAVASAFTVDREAEALCRSNGIELLKPQAQGGTYSSTPAGL